AVVVGSVESPETWRRNAPLDREVHNVGERCRIAGRPNADLRHDVYHPRQFLRRVRDVRALSNDVASADVDVRVAPSAGVGETLVVEKGQSSDAVVQLLLQVVSKMREFLLIAFVDRSEISNRVCVPEG